MSELEALYADHIAILTARTEAALAKTGYDALVICSGKAALKNRFDDQHAALAPTPSFTHWLPLAEPDAFIVIRPGQRPTVIRTLVNDYWDSAPVQEAPWALALWRVIDVAADQHHAELPTAGRVAVVSRDDEPSLTGDANPPALIAALEATRTQKTPYERACLRIASARAARGHLRCRELFANGDPSELELHLAYLAATGQADSQIPYQNIVARGRNAAVLHHINYQTTTSGRTDDALLVDAGAKAFGQCSDITRTTARGTGVAARQFAALIDGLDRVQQTVCGEIRVGLAYEALHDRTHELLAQLLLDSGLGRGDAQALVARGVTRALLPHGLGHSLGVQVHDVGMRLTKPRPDNQFLRNTSTIEVDQVFTIEPGLYFIDALLAPIRGDGRAELLDWAMVDALTPFGGIRIEDNVAVNPTGIENLTRAHLPS